MDAVSQLGVQVVCVCVCVRVLLVLNLSTPLVLQPAVLSPLRSAAPSSKPVMQLFVRWCVCLR